jgi:two-component system heavy metal sensor histidine kinase CusS
MSSKNAKIERNGFGRLVRRWSIERRLTLLYVAFSFLMLTLAGAYLYWSLAEDAERDDNAFLANKIQECRRLLIGRPSDMPLLAHEIQTEAAASQFIKYYVRLLDERGQVILETPGMSELLPTGVFSGVITAEETPSRGRIWKSASGVSYLLLGARARASAEGDSPRTLQAALNVSSDEALISGYRWRLVAVAAAGILFSCAAGMFAARKALAPLREITKATERITASKLHERISASGWPVELASLAKSFDQMLERLGESFKRLSQFSADLAHELRTPVNNLRGETGVALSKARTADEYRHTLESSLEEYARLSRLIENMLFLARADGPKSEMSCTRCDARKAIDVVREFYEPLAEDRGILVRCEGQGSVTADPLLFRQAVSNLLSNALNHTARGGNVAVRVTEREDAGVEVCISDTGCGIPAEHLPRIFDRLYRVDPARSGNGAGLGLAIVKSIMELHGGSVEVKSEPGKGTGFTLFFPPAEAAPQLTKM